MAAKKKKNRLPGIVSKVNGFLRGIKIGLPAIGSFQLGLPLRDAAIVTASRYSSFDLGSMTFNVDGVLPTAGFYAGNVVEQKFLSALRIPQMAGQKKILAIVGQYLPELQAADEFRRGVPAATVTDFYGQRSIGYTPSTHQSFLDSEQTRSRFGQTLFARAALGLISRFVGPMVNKHLPKGINI